MFKKTILLLAAIACVSFSVVSCNRLDPEPDPIVDPDPDPQPGPEPEPEPTVTPVDFKLSVPITQNWIYDGNPAITIEIENPNEFAVIANAMVRISYDRGGVATTIEKSVEVPASGKINLEITPEEALEPGFYRASCFVNNKVARHFTLGVSPFDIVSAPDMQDDFSSFWESTLAELEAVDMEATLTEITSRSSEAQKVYLVQMKSIPDGPGGEPVTVRGYYLEPQDGKKHPVLMHYYGYDDLRPSGKLDCPSGSSNPQYAEFYLSTRGQIINNRTAAQRKDGIDEDYANIYGDWFAYNFGNRDGYYYRGAFMDCVQAVRFMATRPTSDMDNLFAEGSSQGGAFSYAAAALSPYPFTAIAPCVAFLGDFPDYFQIVSWPASVAKSSRGTMTDSEMYAFLSYFDTKNLATRTHAAVIACSGLMDGTCPPHTNIAPFNNLPTADKEYYFYPTMQHSIPSDWPSKYTKFFKERMK